MSYKDCQDFVAQAVPNITDDEIARAFERYDEIRGNFIRQGKTDNLDIRIGDQIANEARLAKYNAVKARRSAIINKQKFKTIVQHQEDMYAKGHGPADTLIYRMEGGQTNDFGVRDTVDNLKNSYTHKWIGGMLADAVKEMPTIMKLAQSPEFDKAFAMELGELRQGGTPGKSGNVEAQKFAQIAKRYKEEARLTYNRKGGFMGNIDGHVAQSHDAFKMVRAGKLDWVERMYQSLDLEKTFAGIDPSNETEIKGILNKTFDQIVTGQKFNPKDIAPVAKGNPSSLVDRFSHERVYHFKDLATQIQYHQDFGHGGFISSVVHGMEQLGKASAMMDHFGTNPEIMVKHVASYWTERLGRELLNVTDPAEHAKISKQIAALQDRRLRAYVDEMTGVAAVPANVNFANVGTGIRALNVMARMGRVLSNSVIGDSFNMIGASVYGGQKGVKAFAPIFRMLESIPKAERREFAYRFGEGFQGFLGSLHAGAVESGTAGGRMSKALNSYFKWIGVTGMYDHARQAFVRERGAWLGMNKGKTFSELHPQLQNGLLRNGIDETRWEAMRQAETRASNGNDYLMPDDVRSVPEQYIEKTVMSKIQDAYAAAKVDEAKLPETRQKRQAAFDKRRADLIDEGRYDLEMKLRGYYADETNYGVVTPNAYSKRVSRGAVFGSTGLQPGSLIGEIVKSMFMYKSFTIANFNNLARALEDRNYMALSLKGTGVITRLLALNVLGGFVTEYIKDAANGNWPPPNPFSPAFIAKAVSTGGPLGIYGDYLINLMQGYDIQSSILGPEVKSIADVGKFAFHDVWTQKKGKAGKALDLALNYTPYANLIVARPVVDSLILDQLREWSSPGYRAKQRQKLHDKGQYNVFQQMGR